MSVKPKNKIFTIFRKPKEILSLQWKGTNIYHRFLCVCTTIQVNSCTNGLITIILSDDGMVTTNYKDNYV